MPRRITKTLQFTEGDQAVLTRVRTRLNKTSDAETIRTDIRVLDTILEHVPTEGYAPAIPIRGKDGTAKVLLIA